MKAVISSAKMFALDQFASDVLNIPSQRLMKNAGHSMTGILFDFWKNPLRALVLAGPGNNGGDAHVVAQDLFKKGIQVTIWQLKAPSEKSKDACCEFQISKENSIPFLMGESKETLKAVVEQIEDCDVIVDGLFGIGLQRDLSGCYAEIIRHVNQHPEKVMSLDIPSGIDGDTGAVRGIAIKSAVTATCAFIKRGMLECEGPNHCGEIRIADIGFPKNILELYEERR